MSVLFLGFITSKQWAHSYLKENRVETVLVHVILVFFRYTEQEVSWKSE